MIETISTAFDGFPYEAIIIGRMLTGYGEMEFDLAMCLSNTIGDLDGAAKAMYRVRGEANRVKMADALMRQQFVAAGLEVPFGNMILDMDHCKAVRNRYAHCHWIPENGRLCYVDVEEIVFTDTTIDFTKLRSYPVDQRILDAQESYFRYVQRLVWWLNGEIQVHKGKLLNHAFVRPSRPNRPSDHK
jgi:hypothetical protein